VHDEGNGKFFQYSENGIVTEEVDYVKGVKHGWEITYYATGKIKSKTPYLYGDKHGTAITYSADGKMTQKTIYYNDNALSIEKL
jgi:antitoxin component YwqK of YwqJK toxin-antitoxin module